MVSTRTNTARSRKSPLTAKVKAVIEMRRTDPTGKEHGQGADVFRNEVGEPIKRSKRSGKLYGRRPAS